MQRNCVPLPEDDARLLFSQLAAAVDHLHRCGFIHRDIKCENVLLSGLRNRTVLLADFGFATRYVKGERSLVDPWGSLHYSSPEICARVPYEGPEVDVWSLGVVLFAWTTGRLPFAGDTEGEMQQRIRAGSYLIPAALSDDLTALISGMMNVDRSTRLSLLEIRRHPGLPLPLNQQRSPQLRGGMYQSRDSPPMMLTTQTRPPLPSNDEPTRLRTSSYRSLSRRPAR